MVLAEAYSVIIRTQAIKANFKGGYKAFLHNLPNQTHCSDRELDRVGFMVWDDMMNYVKFLEESGLTLKKDYTLFHMLEGPIVESDWIEWARLQWFEDSQEAFTFAWLSSEYGGKEELVAACPKGWSTIKSIKETDCTPAGEFKKRFQLLRAEGDGFCTYYDKWADQIRYVGRS